MEKRICQNCKKEFVIEPDDFSFYERIKVPPPTFCWKCRAARRLNFWNEHNLYRVKDAVAGKEMFSTFSTASPVKVYERDYWWSDAWDPLAYGREYDFSRPFFEQFHDLLKAVPWPSRSVRDMVNSDYSNQATAQKNCYMCFNGGYSEDCLYGVAFRNMRSSIEFYAALNSDQCYGVYQVDKCYRVFFSEECLGCQDVWFSTDCVNCQNCFGCVGLRHKQYYLFNKPCSKEEYFEEIGKYDLGSYRAVTDLLQRKEGFKLKFPFKYMHGILNKDASGDYVYRSNNAHFCYEAGDVENSKFIQNTSLSTKDTYDYSNWGQNAELIYESVSCGDQAQNLKFCFDCWPACNRMEYSMNCHASSDCFGCIGFQKKQYCILNRQYSKEEYEALVPKIKKHMDEMPYADAGGRVYRYGEFFPYELSPTAYNESKAQDYFPLTEETAREKKLTWYPIERKEFQTTMSAGDLPDGVKDAGDATLNEKIGCLRCGRAYRIIAPELDFHRRFGLPLPRLCFNCRYTELLRSRNPLDLWHRRCQCAGTNSGHGAYANIAKHAHGDNPCSNEFETSYAPERPEIVYCEACYNAEIA